jgi:hypothetical protein
MKEYWFCFGYFFINSASETKQYLISELLKI